MHSEELAGQFIEYVEQCFVQKLPSLRHPQRQGRELADYERYYQAINLYYSFSKAMELPFDEQWVYDTRQRVSEQINFLL